MTENKWEHFPHGADIGVRGIGETVEKAFEMAALALTAVVTTPDKITPQVEVKIECDEEDIELLFYDWMNALIYEMDTRNEIYRDFEIKIQGNHLSARINGEKVDFKKHDAAVDVKGATFTELKVKKNGNWIAQCVVDV